MRLCNFENGDYFKVQGNKPTSFSVKQHMTITECIQDAAEDIIVQQSAVDQLRETRKSLLAVFLGSSTLFWANLLLLTPSLFETSLTGVFCLVIVGHVALTQRKLSLTHKLLSQSRFYHDLIVEETYAGKAEFQP